MRRDLTGFLSVKTMIMMGIFDDDVKCERTAKHFHDVSISFYLILYFIALHTKEQHSQMNITI